MFESSKSELLCNVSATIIGENASCGIPQTELRGMFHLLAKICHIYVIHSYSVYIHHYIPNTSLLCYDDIKNSSMVGTPWSLPMRLLCATDACYDWTDTCLLTLTYRTLFKVVPPYAIFTFDFVEFLNDQI